MDLFLSALTMKSIPGALPGAELEALQTSMMLCLLIFCGD
jgi:hypothetical protein